MEALQFDRDRMRPVACHVGTYGWVSKGAQQPFSQGRSPCPAREGERAERQKVAEPRVDLGLQSGKINEGVKAMEYPKMNIFITG